MSYKLEPAIWSRDTGQRLSFFDKCQCFGHNMAVKYRRVHGKPGKAASLVIWSRGAILGKSAVVRRGAPVCRISIVNLRKHEGIYREKPNGTGEYSTMSVARAEKYYYAVILTRATGFLLASKLSLNLNNSSQVTSIPWT